MRTSITNKHSTFGRDILICILLLYPPIMEYIDSFNSVFSFFNIAKIILCVITIVYMFVNNYISWLKAFAFLFVAVTGFSTVMHNGNLRAYAQFFVCVLVSTVIGEELFIEDTTFKTVTKYLLTINLFNFISMIIMRDGIISYAKENTYVVNKIWLFGPSNVMTAYLVFSITVFLIALYKQLLSNKVITCGIISIVGSVLLGDSATGKVSVLLILTIFFVYKYNDSSFLRKLLNFKFLFKVVAVLFVTLVLLNATSIFAGVFEDVLGKDITLTGRTDIWKIATKEIIKKPLLGYGIQSPDFMYSKITASHCHDYYLNILFESGTIGFGFWIAYISIFSNKLYQNRKQLDFVIILIGVGVFSFLIAQITETYNNRYLCGFYMLIGYGYNYCRIKECN